MSVRIKSGLKTAAILSGAAFIFFLVCGLLFGMTGHLDSRGARIETQGLVPLAMDEARKQYAFESQHPSVSQGTEKATEQVSKPIPVNPSSQAVESQPADISAKPKPAKQSFPDIVHVLNGRSENHFAQGAYALIELPGLTPGSHVQVSITVPYRTSPGNAEFKFEPRVVGDSGVFRARLPRYIDVARGGGIDLSERRYQFDMVIDDPRFSKDCRWRYAVMTEHDDYMRFVSAEKVFCGKSDPIPELY